MYQLGPVLLVVFSATLAIGQSPVDPKGTVTAEATEVISARPDQVKMIFAVQTKGGDAKSAEDQAADRVKDMLKAFTALKIKGMKVELQGSRVTRGESQNQGVGGPGVPPPLIDYRVLRAIHVTLSTEAATLPEMVDKVQQEAAKFGVTGESGSMNYNGFAHERLATVRLIYSRKGGWDDLAVPALEKATRKAKSRAESMARGLGLSLGEVVSISEPQNQAPTSTTYYNYNSSSLSDLNTEEYVDGELQHKVRVRVVFSTKNQ